MSRGRRRPALQTNEENPIPEDLQWDDSMGLNIIENPLETLDVIKNIILKKFY